LPSLVLLTGAGFLTAAGVIQFGGATTNISKSPEVPLEIGNEGLVDLGEARQYQSLAIDTIIRNRSDHVFTIHDISQSCDCTQLTPERRALGPFESIRLVGALQTGSSRGVVTRRVYIRYSDSENPERLSAVEATVKVKVEPDYDFRPEVLAFSEGVASLECHVVARTPHGSRPIRCDCDRPWFEASISPQPDESGATIVTVTFDPKKAARAGVADASGELAVYKDETKGPAFRVPLHVEGKVQ